MSYGLASLGLNVAAEEVQVFPSAAFSFSYGEASALVRPTITSANSAVSLSTTTSKAYKNTKSVNNISYSSASSNTYGVIYLTGLCNPVITTSSISVSPKSYLNSLGFIESSSSIEEEHILTKFSEGIGFAYSNTLSKPIGLFNGLGTLNTYSSIEVNPSKRIKVKGTRPAKAYGNANAIYQIWSFAYGKPKLFKALVTGTTYQVGRGRTTFRGYLEASANRIINLNEIGLSESTLKGIGASLRNIYQELEPTLVIQGDGDRLSNGIRYVEFIGKSISIGLSVMGKLAITPYTGILARAYLDSKSTKIKNINVIGKAVSSIYEESTLIKLVQTTNESYSNSNMVAISTHIKGIKGIGQSNVSMTANPIILNTKNNSSLLAVSTITNTDIVKIKTLGTNLTLSIFAISTGEAIQSNASIESYCNSFSFISAVSSIIRASSNPRPSQTTASLNGDASLSKTNSSGSVFGLSSILSIPNKIVIGSSTLTTLSSASNTNYTITNTSITTNDLIAVASTFVTATKIVTGKGDVLLKGNLYGNANELNTAIDSFHLIAIANASIKPIKIVVASSSIYTLSNLLAIPTVSNSSVYVDECNITATANGLITKTLMGVVSTTATSFSNGESSKHSTKSYGYSYLNGYGVCEATKIVNSESAISIYVDTDTHTQKIKIASSYLYLRAANAAYPEVSTMQSLVGRASIVGIPKYLINVSGFSTATLEALGIGYKNRLNKAPSTRTLLVQTDSRVINLLNEYRTLEVSI